MLVIDQENDRALLSRQSRYVPRKWSCLAGFMEVPFFANGKKNDRNTFGRIRLLALMNITSLFITLNFCSTISCVVRYHVS